MLALCFLSNDYIDNLINYTRRFTYKFATLVKAGTMIKKFSHITENTLFYIH